jgi:hypothetical protein
VVVVGNGPSAHDILREISSVAKEVHQALRVSDVHFKKLENHNNIWQHSVVLCSFYQKMLFPLISETLKLISCTSNG